jgi:hypothetical protein
MSIQHARKYHTHRTRSSSSKRKQKIHDPEQCVGCQSMKEHVCVKGGRCSEEM